MKILLINSLYEPNLAGGAERSVRILAEALLSHGHEPTVLCTAAGNSEAVVSGIRVIYCKTPNLYWMMQAGDQPSLTKSLWHLIDSNNLMASGPLHRIMSELQPDIVHTNNLSGFSVQAWTVASKLGLPILHTIRDHYLLCPRSLMYRNGQRCVQQCFECRLLSMPRKRASAKVNAVTGVGKYILDKHLERGFFASASVKTYIYNPVDPANKSTQRMRTDDRIVFGFVGMLVEAKGIEYLLERFADVDHKRAILKVYGRGVSVDYENYLRDRFQANNIVFEGVCAPEKIYAEIDVAIVPSLWDEPFGRVVPEAYSHGLPVIVSNRGALPEIVREGRTGFVFDPNQEGELESCIGRVLDDPDSLNRMADSCRREADKYSREAIAQQYLNLYQGLIS